MWPAKRYKICVDVQKRFVRASVQGPRLRNRFSAYVHTIIKSHFKKDALSGIDEIFLLILCSFSDVCMQCNIDAKNWSCLRFFAWNVNKFQQRSRDVKIQTFHLCPWISALCTFHQRHFTKESLEGKVICRLHRIGLKESLFKGQREGGDTYRLYCNIGYCS
jgi:hypothetical protein